MKNKAIMNWSSGKDSSYCLYKALKDKTLDIKYLLTTVNADLDRVSMHGVRKSLLEQQADSIGLPLIEVALPSETSLESYNRIMEESLFPLIKKGIDHSIFGDIFLEDLRKHREENLNKIGMKGIFPLWKISTTELMNEIIDLGFKAIVVCVNDRYFDSNVCGKIIDKDFMASLPKDVDPCGENGEFHTFVFDGPIFSKPIEFAVGDVVHKVYESSKDDESDSNNDIGNSNHDTGFWYLDLIG